jgi:hypothetical protein
MKKDLSNTVTASLQLAEQFTDTLGLLGYKTAGKKPMSRNTIQKAIAKAKKQHDALKSELDKLEADDSKLKTRLDDTRSKLQFTRKQLLNMHRGMQHMDIANADDAVFYDDDDRIGYVIKGKEYHMDINDCGDVTLIPMGKYLREQRAQHAPEVAAVEDGAAVTPEASVLDSETMSADDAGSISDDDLMNYLHNSLADEE